jgi:iron complex outermembrane receptor protein
VLHRISIRAAVAAAAALPAVAQAQAGPTALAPVVVTANPVGGNVLELIEPVNQLHGAALRERRQPTLGETLNGEPGVSSTYFGPNSSRPVIRGLGGFDIRVLSNGVGVLDASASSPDHAVAVEPLTLDRVEVVRGPAAVMYGGNAVGGVVNAIDGRIPREGLKQPLGGVLDGTYNSVNNGRGGIARLDAGNDRFALRADVFRRDNDLLRLPGYAWTPAVQAQRGETGPSGKLANSQGEAWGGALGGSVLFRNGYTGLAYSQYDTDYGVVAEPDVTIRLKQRRGDLAGELRDLGGTITGVRYRLGYSDYNHQEIGGDGTVGTTFENKGYNARVELQHGKLGPFTGAFGVEALGFRLSASGDEAFLPATRTQSYAAFAYEEMPMDKGRLMFGLRAGYVSVEADSYAPTGAPSQSRSFAPVSGAAGVFWPVAGTLGVAANLSYTERAPTYQELYADGPHIATAQFEVGNPNLGMVRSTAVDLALKSETGPVTGSVGVFYNRFRNFLALEPTGLFRNPETRAVVDPALDPDALPEAVYQGVPARFYGFEAQIAVPVATWWKVTVQGDYTHATNTQTGQPLPYIPPLRAGAGVVYEREGFRAGLTALAAAAQDRVPQFVTTTAGYVNVTVVAAYRFDAGPVAKMEAFVQANNLLDQTIRYSTSTLKDIAPAGARAVVVGLRGTF